jgi:CRP/FNR family transcriptional regulator
MICSDIGNGAIEVFRDFAPFHIYPVGVALFAQGSSPREVYVLETGLVKLVHVAEHGQESIIDLRFPGSLLGSACALLDKPHPVTALTLTRCQLAYIPSQTFRHLVKGDFGFQVQRMCALEAFEAMVRLERQICLSARQRVELLLWQFTRTVNQMNSKGEVRLHLPLKHWELAQLVDVTPQYLSVLMKRLENDGLLKRGSKWLILRNREALWHDL